METAIAAPQYFYRAVQRIRMTVRRRFHPRSPLYHHRATLIRPARTRIGRTRMPATGAKTAQAAMWSATAATRAALRRSILASCLPSVPTIRPSPAGSTRRVTSLRQPGRACAAHSLAAHDRQAPTKSGKQLVCLICTQIAQLGANHTIQVQILQWYTRARTFRSAMVLDSWCLEAEWSTTDCTATMPAKGATITMPTKRSASLAQGCGFLRGLG